MSIIGQYGHIEAENKRLLKLLERTVEQHVPLTELEGVPGWSRVVELVEVVTERDELRAELSDLRTGFDAQNDVIAGLRKDADRYRWLRDGAGYCDTRDIPGMAPARMDEFIDAAMGKGGNDGA